MAASGRHGADPGLRPGERSISERLEGSPLRSRPLSRSARQRQRTLESQLVISVLPRHIERLREIADEIAVQSFRLERAHVALWRACEGDAEDFAHRWRDLAERWRFEDVNELIRAHNAHYPAEARLPLDPRTGDYVKLRGRSYRREELGPGWILDHFPASPPSAA